MAAKKPATKRHKDDFIGFILKAENNKKLTEEFMVPKNAEDLYDFFKDKKFFGIPFGDCEDILNARDNWDALTDEGHGKPPCRGPKRGY